MAKKTSAIASQKRKPRLLWANPFCLMDTSSGASMTVRQMLLQLVAHGYEIQILGATVFDDAKGMGRLKEQYPDLSGHLHQMIEVEDGPLNHQLVVSYSHNRHHLTTHEEGLWYSQYLYLLDSFKPDLVWFYGGQTLDLLIADEARDRGIPVAFYLANGNYKSARWCRDVDLILTDSQATADMYRKTVGYAAKPVGKFIDPGLFVAARHERKRLLFINPSWQKGASIFVQLAEKLERERADIELEVVEARADWSAVLRETTGRMGQQRSSLNNVVVTPNTSDMRGPYGRARVLIAPSLWWESSGRVLAEAMLNGIPALITNRGGMPEMIDKAGIAFDFPDMCYEEPHQSLLGDAELQPLYDAVVTLFDDEALYQEYVGHAWQVGEQKHHIARATERLLSALMPLVKLHAGNKDFAITQKKRHRQRLASRATKPEFKVDTSLQQLIGSKQEMNVDTQTAGLWLSDGFTWQFKSKIIVLDSRAKLLKSGLAEQMAATAAFGIVAFDPGCEMKDVQKYEGSDHIQVFQHALLGDGQPTTLNACVAPELSGTLTPLPPEQLPKHRRLGAQPIAELPINTVALDSISGLGSLDWLILDELSDAMAVLEHGKQSLKETLLIQARVVFQPTHERQPSIAELQHWGSRNGFRFYRFHDIQHYSHLPEQLNAQEDCATEQESADVLFLPSHERMATLTDEQKMKLAFVLSSVFRAHDIAFDLVATVSQEQAIELLESQGFLPKTIDNSLPSSAIATQVYASVEEGASTSIPESREGSKLENKKGETSSHVGGEKKHAVIMISFGERPWLHATSELARLYAEKIGADYFLITEAPSFDEFGLPDLDPSIGRGNKEVYAYKLYFPWKMLAQQGYDRVLLVDDSSVIKEGAPDIFSQVPDGFSGYAWSDPDETLISLAGIYAWAKCESGFPGHAIQSTEGFYRSLLFGKVNSSEIKNPVSFLVGGEVLEFDINHYANTAAMVFDKTCVDAISPSNVLAASELLYSAQPNQTLWWYLLTKHNLPVYKISSRWNWLLGWGMSIHDRRGLSDASLCSGVLEANITHVTSAYGHREKLIKQLCHLASQAKSSQVRSKKDKFEVRNDPGLYSNFLSSIIESSKVVDVVQVGANDGKINDPIYDIVRKNKNKTRIVLIEPQTNLLPHLEDNYRTHPKVKIVNCAIGRKGVLSLYRVKPEFYNVFIPRYLIGSPDYRVPSGFASFDRAHVEKHVLGNIPKGLGVGDVIEELNVKSLNLREVVEDLPWSNKVDILQVDAEGMDDVVIYESSIDFYKPKLINFEHSHLSDVSYSELCGFLAKEGYEVIRYSSSDTLARKVDGMASEYTVST